MCGWARHLSSIGDVGESTYHKARAFKVHPDKRKKFCPLLVGSSLVQDDVPPSRLLPEQIGDVSVDQEGCWASMRWIWE